jgi:multidrug efflux system outer membrane protein
MKISLHAKRKSRSIAALAAALMLSGCMSLAPDYVRPQAPVAAQFPDMQNASSATASQIEWQQFFPDSALRNLIAQALENNRDLRVAVLNIEQARAQYQVRRADMYPTVGVAFNGQRMPSSTGQKSSYAAGLSATSYELDFFGRIRSLSDAGLSQYLASEEARKNVHIGLVASVANAYLVLLADQDLLALTVQTLKAREEQFKLTQLKFDNGVVSALDFRQAESLLESARATLAQQQRQRALDENALVLLVGQPLKTALPQGATLAGVKLGSALPAGLPSDFLTSRPDIRAAERQLMAANANIGAARAAFFPRISLTGSAGVASTELSGLFPGALAWTFTSQIVQPLFDAGRNQGNLDVATAQRDIAVAQYERTIQTAFREVADALAGRATFDEQLRAQKAQADAESARFTLSDLRYRNGASSYLDLLDAQRALFAAQQATVQVMLAHLQNQVSLYKVLGGGWSDKP